MRKLFLMLAALLGLAAQPVLAHEGEHGTETEEHHPWNIEISSTIPVANGLEQTSTVHFGREIGEHVDLGVFGSWIGKDWSEKKEQFYGTDVKYFFHSFGEHRKTNFYVSLGLAYNTLLESEGEGEKERANEIRYGWKFGASHRICKDFSIFVETGQDVVYNPKKETYRDDLSGLLLVGLKYDF
ncbi:MAG: hypothetical protein ACK5JS_00615 [Mangrovibacterium sp.]